MRSFSRKASCVSSKWSSVTVASARAKPSGKAPAHSAGPSGIQADEVLLDLGSPVVEDEADYRREGHDSLHGEAGHQVDGAHQHAHGGYPEKGARELEPLRPG